MTEKEKQIQIAIGTLNIPELIPVNLRNPNFQNGADYLVFAPTASSSWTTAYYDANIEELVAASGYAVQLDECEGIWLIKERTSNV